MDKAHDGARIRNSGRMLSPRDLPASLGTVFHIAEAAAHGVSLERMRRADLVRPFAGIRVRDSAPAALATHHDDFARRSHELRMGALAYAPRLRPGQFFSHETAAALWGAPLPTPADREGAAPVHVSVFGDAPLPRLRGVIAHRARVETSTVRVLGGVPVSSPATTWASLGTLPLYDVVAIGDYLCRMWRMGRGRPDAGREPLATRDELAASIAAGRRVGIRRLRQALTMVREDSWSPRESLVRCILHDYGLPEPSLNIDVFDDEGSFLGCLDLAFPEQKAGVEYHGLLHAATYAKDVERMARLRAAGWTIIEVTAESLRDEGALVRRIRAVLRGR